MKVCELIDRLTKLQDQGYSEYDVCYFYEEDNGTGMKLPVRDTINHIEKADTADGEEIHMWN